MTTRKESQERLTADLGRAAANASVERFGSLAQLRQAAADSGNDASYLQSWLDAADRTIAFRADSDSDEDLKHWNHELLQLWLEAVASFPAAVQHELWELFWSSQAEAPPRPE